MFGRPSPQEYELESLGLNQNQIEKILTRLPPSSIPEFIECWKQQTHLRNMNRTPQNTHMSGYQPRIIPKQSQRISHEDAEDRYQEYSQERNGIHQNLDMIAKRFFGAEPHDGYNREYIHQKFKELSRILHPDKGGNTNEFMLLKTVYTHVMDKIQETQQNSLENEAFDTHVYSENKRIINTAIPPPKTFFNNKFDNSAFNSYYEKNSLKDPNSSDGYDTWLKNEHVEKVEVERPTESNFNSAFEHAKQKYGKKISRELVVKNMPPQEIQTSDQTYNVLGQGKVKDYSGKNGTIQFADLKRAHERPHLLYEEDVVQDREYETRNVSKSYEVAVQQNRQAPTKMTDDEVRFMKKREEEERHQEEMRNYRLRQHDEDIANHFKKVGVFQIRE